MIIDIGSLSPQHVYFTLTQTIIPRPIAWILTRNSGGNGDSDGSGSLNLAPFSYFNAVCSDPALLMVSIGVKPDGGRKDSLVNLLQNQECVVHIGSLSSIDDINQSSASLDYGESEVSQLELVTEEFEGFDLPRLSVAPIAMACSLYKHDVIGNGNQNLVFLEVQKIYYRDDIIHFQDSPFRLSVDALKVDPLCRLGSGDYANLERTHSVKRPD